MHGELAQLVAVAAHGSAWLAGRTGDAPPELETSNTTFQYVRGVRFELAGSLLRSGVKSTAIADWLTALQKRGVTRIWLAAPGGPGSGEPPWHLIATARGRDGERWDSAWTVGDREAPDRRIWDVVYRGRRISDAAPANLNPAETLERLTAVLRETETFAAANDLDEWAAVFSAATRLGSSADPVPPYYSDMLPATAFGRGARRLLAMATRAYVFGGMGSWNDLGFEAPETAADYQRLTRELHAAVLDGVVAAVNGPLDR